MFMIIFLKRQKTIFLYPNATSNGTHVMGISKGVHNNWTHPPKVNIERATAISLKKILEKSENLRKYCFFKQMAVSCSIFTLGGWVQLFQAAFDLIFTVVTLKVALGWHKFDFWALKKIIMDIHLRITLVFSAFWANNEWSVEITL